MTTESAQDWRVRWRLFFAEAIGTAALVFGGVSMVIVMSGDGSPVARLVPNEWVRTALTAFLFGCVGTAVALSRVGKESGAHINPAVTMSFWMMRKLDGRTAVGYILAQLAGASVGALPLLAWGAMGRSVAFGATIPGAGYSTTTVVMGEAVTTFALLTTLCVFLAFPPLRRFTPFVIPFSVRGRWYRSKHRSPVPAWRARLDSNQRPPLRRPRTADARSSLLGTGGRFCVW